MQLRLEHTNGFEVGDFIEIIKTVNQTWIDTVRSDIKKDSVIPHGYRFRHLRRIVTIEGATITVDAPLPQSVAREHGGGEVVRVALRGYTSHAGVEGLCITSTAVRPATAETGQNRADASGRASHMRVGISLRRCMNVWVRGCTVLNATESAVEVRDSQYVTVRYCKPFRPVPGKRGVRSHAYSSQNSSMVLIYACAAQGAFHDFVVGKYDTGPIAFVKNSVAASKGTSPLRSGWASGILFDSIRMSDGGGISCGTNGNCVIWNCTAPAIEVPNPPTPEQNFAIGCRLTRKGKAPAAMIGDGYIESFGTQVKPASLFEQQLADRLGRRTAFRNLTRILSKASLPSKVVFPIPLVDGKPQGGPTPEQIAFDKANERRWKTVFADDCTGDWKRNWFLDGEGATVTNSPRGMELKAIDTAMVLWTRPSFQGDLKIEYEFTRTDHDGPGVCIIYIQATGSGEEGFDRDISKWNDFRKTAAMGNYFKYMHTYHISYACGYVRGRRYRPDIKKMNTYSELWPEYVYPNKAFFKTGEPCKITIIKTARQIRMKAASHDKVMYFMLDNRKWPPISEGRIGLRQMRGRSAIYKNFRISIPE
ncbi:MAG: DUF1961 family protein [Lentisphaerae bacterium]|nr:MAG: DUF1961 family protein [Lentisphaerota bacterium]